MFFFKCLLLLSVDYSWCSKVLSEKIESLTPFTPALIVRLAGPGLGKPILGTRLQKLQLYRRPNIVGRLGHQMGRASRTC